MLRLRRLQAFLALLLAGTLALGLASAARPAGEIFPFASWFLFSLVPGRVTTYELRVRQLDERIFDPPRPLPAVENFAASPRSSTTFEAVQRYARSVLGGGPDNQAAAWRNLRARLMDFHVVRFDLVELTFDPLERFRTGRTAERTVAAGLQAGPNDPPMIVP